MSNYGHRWPLVVLFLVAVLLRLAAIHWLAGAPQWDELDNHRLAVNLLAGEGYGVTPGHPTTYLPPVYPAFIASVYALSRPDYRIVWYVQAALNASLVFLLFNLGRLLFSESVGYLAAGAHALHPSFEIVTTLYRENVLILLLVALCYCLVRGIKEGGSGFFLLAGGTTGLLVLTNPIYLV
ncbi:MAG: glycosyltransferase family 39 protein, partial [Candidatus Methylomirabilis sp.]